MSDREGGTMQGTGTPDGPLRLRPHRSLFGQSVVAVFAFLVPVFAVLYFLTVPAGPWPVVLATNIVALALLGIAVVNYVRLGIWVDARGISERGFFGRMRRVAVEDIGSLLLVHTYNRGGADTVPQLFVCDRHGTQLIRMRGQFWPIGNMTAVLDTLGVPVTELSESVTTRELLERYPGLLYWFERRPILAAAFFSAAVIVGGVLLYVGLALLGVTTSIV
jgi:hypothetical protein